MCQLMILHFVQLIQHVLQYFAEKVPLIAAIKETSMLGIMQIGHVEEILGT